MTFSFDIKGVYRLFATIALAAAVCEANAADMPIKAPPLAPVFSWGGFYVGANVGYSYGPWNSTSLGTDLPSRSADVGSQGEGLAWWRAGWLQLAIQSDRARP